MSTIRTDGFWTGGRARWRAVCWLIRTAILVGVWVAWHLIQEGSYTVAAAWGGTVVVAIVLQHIAWRLALGWIVDDTGERQKVTAYHDGKVTYTPTSREARQVDEILATTERRSTLVKYGLIVLGLGAFAYARYSYTEPAGNESFVDGLFTALAFVAALFCGLITLCFLLPFGFIELLYQTGYQDMTGAKVLDVPPYRPGLREVATQKAHGDARVVDEAEAQAVLNPKRP